MGLAGPRIKQRIPADPRNLAWSDDQTKFGYRMLSKMGWSPGKGLGLNEDGEKEYVKPSNKQDNLGIGATKKTIDNWLDNSSAFDELLKGLNDKIQTKEKVKESDEKEKSRKGNEQYNSDDKMKIDKVESKKKKKKKKNKKENGNKNKDKEIISISNLQPSSSLSTTNINSSESLYSIRLAHRAKFLKSKKASVQNSDRLNEIFGIKSSKDFIDDINTESITVSDTKNLEEKISKVDIITKVNELSSHEYFAQKMKGLRISGIRSEPLVSHDNETNDDIDERPSFSVNNEQDINISNNSSKSINTNKKRKINDVNIDLLVNNNVNDSSNDKSIKKRKKKRKSTKVEE
ncbi:hypothetical protein RclHR1_00410019 [Rhizophagus clarus]|uniref:PIN2/TERF1-interacting telomerase inhibitor 1 isoform X1 n=1 Tax=Rhizophagus clarus TaxID=94130 RepID=A0A2Z6RXM1_9GLOM|nr:hypothetical protein RclHR1_00410019 [Rhizophagus clarus]GES78931.1 PIN2/TERF1-interacting telomerase inhibitor 1 isoform X1 [Rhizophagus clarus]